MKGQLPWHGLPLLAEYQKTKIRWSGLRGKLVLGVDFDEP
jgi:hypothetical protein